MTQFVWSESDFEWLQPITSKWEAIRDYALSKVDQLVPYRETHIYKGGWKIYGLRNQMTNWSRPDAFMDELFQQLPFQPFICTFSCLEAGVVIHPHKGFTDDVIRFHLGLVCPPNVGIRIGDVDYTWHEGKWLIFNDRITHSIANRSDASRYVLLMDFYRKDIGLDAPQI